MSDASSSPPPELGVTCFSSQATSEAESVRITEVVSNTPTASVRLRNALSEAESDGILPFNTVGEYLRAGENAAELLRRIPRLGTKCVNEFQEIVDQFLDNLGQEVDVASLGLSISAQEALEMSLRKFVESQPNVSVRLYNAIVYADEEGMVPFATVGDYLRAGRSAPFELRRIPNLGTGSATEFQVLVHHALYRNGGQKRAPNALPALEVSLLEFVLSQHAASVRLRNALTFAADQGIVPFQTVGDYVRAGSRGPALMRELPNLGSGSIAEFQAYVDEALMQPSKPDREGASFDILLDGRCPNIGSITKSIAADLQDRQLTIARLRFGQGKTLEAVAQSLGLTRERVRQIESKIQRGLNLPKQRLLKSAAVMLKQYLDAAEIAEISCEKLAEECAASVDELRMYFGLLKKVEPTRHAEFTFNGEDIYFQEKFKPSDQWDQLVHSALLATDWPFVFEAFRKHCAGVPQFYQDTRLSTRYSAVFSGSTLDRPPTLSTYAMCECLALKAGEPFHYSDLRSNIQRHFGVVLTAHHVLATLGRMKEVAICGPGIYVHYENLHYSDQDRLRICDVAYAFLNDANCFVSSKVLFARLNAQLEQFEGMNHYLLMGIVQDDNRFVTKRGNMVGLSSFDIDQTFVALEDEVCELVKKFGPISIPEIMDRMSETRKLCNDSGVRLILSSQPWIVETGYKTYDTSWRVLGSEAEFQRYVLAAKIALLGGTKSSYAIATELKSVGLQKATSELVSALMESVEHTLVGSAYRLLDMNDELEEYEAFAQKALHRNEVLDSDSERFAALKALDCRFKTAPSETIDTPNSELGAILAEFNF